MNPQIKGVEQLSGTYVFDLRASHRTLRLNRFFWNMRTPEFRERFNSDEEKTMQEEGLSDPEKEMVRTRDWIGLVRYGICFFVLEKFARVNKLSNLQVYARMRGESFEDFMKTRRVPGAQ